MYLLALVSLLISLHTLHTILEQRLFNILQRHIIHNQLILNNHPFHHISLQSIMVNTPLPQLITYAVLFLLNQCQSYTISIHNVEIVCSLNLLLAIKWFLTVSEEAYEDLTFPISSCLHPLGSGNSNNCCGNNFGGAKIMSLLRHI